jgi:hypothetical protein
MLGTADDALQKGQEIREVDPGFLMPFALTNIAGGLHWI